MGAKENRAALDAHWAAVSGDLKAEHEIYGPGVLCEYPQSGERIRGRENLEGLRGRHLRATGMAFSLGGRRVGRLGTPWSRTNRGPTPRTLP